MPPDCSCNDCRQQLLHSNLLWHQGLVPLPHQAPQLHEPDASEVSDSGHLVRCVCSRDGPGTPQREGGLLHKCSDLFVPIILMGRGGCVYRTLIWQQYYKQLLCWIDCYMRIHHHINAAARGWGHWKDSKCWWWVAYPATPVLGGQSSVSALHSLHNLFLKGYFRVSIYLQGYRQPHLSWRLILSRYNLTNIGFMEGF